MLDISMIKFDEKGLVPAVVQEENGQVLMLAYMNKESLEKTLETGTTWFWSRSRQELWNKGATSGTRRIFHARTARNSSTSPHRCRRLSSR